MDDGHAGQIADQFRILVDSLVEYAIFLLDPRGNVATWNPGAQRLKRYRPEEILGEPLSRFYTTEDRASGKPALVLATAASTGRCEDEGWRVRKDGSRFWASVVVTALRGADGALLGFGKVTRDLTEQLRTQERGAQDRFRLALNGAPCGMVMAGEDGRILLANAEAEKLFGFGRGELDGQAIEALVPERFRGRHGEQRATYFASPSSRRVGFAQDLFGVGRDGSEFPLEIGLSLIETPAGRCSLAAIVDLTERRSLEQQLNEAQRLSHLGSWEYDVASRRIRCSPEMCRMLSLDPDTRSERDVPPGGDLWVYDRVHVEDRDRVRAAVQAAVREGTSWEGEFRLVNPNGGVRTVSSRVEPLRNAAGHHVRTSGTALDVTEQRTLAAQLARASRLATIGPMAAGVGHEINNPLSYVLTSLELIAEEIRTLAGASPSVRMRDLESLVQDARHGADRVRKFVRELRTFSRADDEHRVAVDLHQVLGVSLTMASNELRHRARVTKDLAPTPLVEADEARLGQVFVNLLVNAAQAIPEGHADSNEIRIVLGTDPSGMAYFEVRDTGRGIPTEVMPHIFDPFYTTKAVGEGTGLGLSISHATIAALGGTISVESEVGTGSVFRVTLPAARAAPPPEPSAPRSVELAPRRARVLVVDDDVDVGKSIRKLLGRTHDVTLVTDAREGLTRLAGGESFDVILCDLMMPGMTGMDFHAAIVSQFSEHAARIVFMSGGVFDASAQTFLDRVQNPRVDKPFNVTHLRNVVNALLR